MNEIEFELDKKTEDVLDQIIDLFDPLNFGHQVYALAMFNEQKAVAGGTDVDIIIDEIVFKANAIFNTLSDREQVYARGILNCLMTNHFEKIRKNCEPFGGVSCVFMSVGGGKQDGK